MATSGESNGCNQATARVMLWCVPRSTSTAFLKCMTYVPNSQVWLEPYLMHYLFSSHGNNREQVVSFFQDIWKATEKEEIDEFGARITSGGYFAGDKSYNWIKEQLEAPLPDKKVIFVKDMCWGIAGYYGQLPTGYRHTFLICHPYRVFDSWKRMINRGTDEDNNKLKITDQPSHHLPLGFHYEEQYDLYLYVKEHFDPNPVIIDTDDLLADPGRVLKSYCEAVGIPYSDDLLRWTPGRECMDQLWMTAKEQINVYNHIGHHRETFASIRFSKPSRLPDRSELSEDVLYCCDRSMKYYEEMYRNKMVYRR
ncbi:uncharacterized protein [Amphiura filiformis]|uniref:uncharacterized protein n=1 Tax=Amphiura filiformis TaxID=82378 RepID=UPI003B20F4CB